MRIAVVSDIHGNLPALEAVHAEIERVGADVVVNLGDICSGPLWPAETLDWLMPRGWPTIAGNHERQVLAPDRAGMGASDAFAAARLDDRHRAWLAALPPVRRLDEEVWCCHGTPTSDLHYLMETVTPNHQRGIDPGLRAASAAELDARDDILDVGGRVQPRLARGRSRARHEEARGHVQAHRAPVWPSRAKRRPADAGREALRSDL